jgi:RNA polymerase sigma-70 factor (ECF subfamily)
VKHRGEEHPFAVPGSFEQLVTEHSVRLHAYLARRAPGQADDLLGDVWLAAFAARWRFDPERGELVGWLFGIARNVVLAHHRGERRRREREHGLADPAETHADGWDEVDARLDAAGSATTLRTALAALPPEEREVLLLVAWEHLTPTEIGTALGVPAGTVRSRLHRARTRMNALVSSPNPTEAMK